MRCTVLLFLCFSLSLAAPRTNPIVTVIDAHGSVLRQEVFFWLSRLSEVKDRVQAKYRISKDTMILWYVPKDRYGVELEPLYNFDESQTFAEFESKFGAEKKGQFFITVHPKQ